MELDHDQSILEFLNSQLFSPEDLDTKLVPKLEQETCKLRELENKAQLVLKEAVDELATSKTKIDQIQLEFAKLLDQLPNYELKIKSLFDYEPPWLSDISLEHQSIARLEAALKYLKLACEITSLCFKIETFLEDDIAIDLKLHSKLLDHLKEIRQINTEKDYPSPLVSYLQDVLEYKVQYTHSALQRYLTRRLESTLEAIHWPQRIELETLACESPEYLKQFRHRFDDLTCFQSQSKIIDLDPVIDLPELQTHFLPFDIMMKAIIIRFRHHFMGRRPTNSLERPEWFLSYITEQLTHHLQFFEDLQPITKPFATSPNFDLKKSFIDSINRLVFYKLNKVQKTLISYPQYLSHFIKEVLEFDNNLLKEGLVNQATTNWRSCSRILVGNPEIFQLWIREEKSFVNQRLREIMQDPRALELLNSVPADCEEDERPTIAADRVSTLFEAITERYMLLDSISLRIRYFAEVQLGLLELFHKELCIFVDRYESRLNAFRPLGTKKMTYFTSNVLSQLQGVIDSSYFFNALLQECDTQPFFLEMWKAINSVSNEASSEPKGLFEDLTLAFSQLASKATLLLGEGLFKEFDRDLKSWLDLKPWGVSKNISCDSDIPASLELSSSLSSLVSNFNLALKLHENTRLDIIKVFANHLERLLLKIKIESNKIPAVRRDFQLILNTLASFYPNPAALFQNFKIPSDSQTTS